MLKLLRKFLTFLISNMNKKINKKQPNAAIIIIGDEILSGRTLDTNSNYIAKKLFSIGVNLVEIVTIADEKKTIIKYVNKYKKKYDYIFTSGGIGPTHDDITSESIADALKIKLEVNEDAKKILKNYYSKKNQIFNKARLKMAKMPTGSRLIKNDISSAPGFKIENIFVLAGIPEVFKNMVDNLIKDLKKGVPYLSYTIVINKPEGDIVENLEKIVEKFKEVSIGSYPFFEKDIIGTNLVVRHYDKEILRKVCGELKKI